MEEALEQFFAEDAHFEFKTSLGETELPMTYESLDGIYPEGWGSKIVPEFDDDGKITSLTRVPTEKDAKFAA